jgi:hypothetical protein
VGHRFRKEKRGGGTVLYSRPMDAAEGHQGGGGLSSSVGAGG